MTAERWLAAAALSLGALAAVAGTPAPAARGQIDVDELASMVVHEEDHVDAVELARWIRDRKTGLRVIDVRPTAEFDEYHVPAAENVPIERLSQTHFSPTETVVLYSGGGAHGAQAWVLLRALGLRQVFFLSGGFDEWVTDVMEPMLPDDATAAEKEAFKDAADISRYFGGTPATGPRVPAAPGGETAAARLSKLKRRGC